MKKACLITVIIQLLFLQSLAGQTQIQAIAGESGLVSSGASTSWINKRNQANGSSIDTSDTKYGSQFANPNYWDRRTRLVFDLSGQSGTCTGAKLYFYENSSTVTTAEAHFGLVRGVNTGAKLALGDFDAFYGWRATGEYPVTYFADTVAMGDVNSNAWNNITLNDSALHYINTAIGVGDITMYLLGSKTIHGVLNPATGNDFIGLDTPRDSGTEPYLQLSFGSTGDVITRSRGNVLHEARGYETQVNRSRNKKYVSKVKKKG